MTEEELDVQRAFELGRSMRKAEQRKSQDRRRNVTPGRRASSVVRAKALRAQWRTTPEGVEALKQKNRRHTLQKNYGLTLAAFESMWTAQGGACACCGDPMVREPKTLDSVHVDHCHKTKKIRGLLHGRCNLAIGMLLDDPRIADAAATYLRKSLQ